MVCEFKGSKESHTKSSLDKKHLNLLRNHLVLSGRRSMWVGKFHSDFKFINSYFDKCPILTNVAMKAGPMQLLIGNYQKMSRVIDS